MPYYENVSRWIKEVPRHLKTQEMCEEALGVESRSLAFVPNQACGLKQLEETNMHSAACLIT